MTQFFRAHFSLPIRHAITLVIFGVCFFMLGNSQYPLFDNSEAHYARVTQEMHRSHDYLTLTFNGQPWFVHPPLYFWLANAVASLFHWSEFGYRFLEGIFGILGLFVTYYFGRLFFSKETGFLGSLILASSLYYIVLSRLGIFDTLFNTFSLASILLLLIGLYDEKHRLLAFSISAVLTALAILTKGPFGLVYPILVLVPFVIWKRQWRLFFSVPTVVYFLVTLAFASPWYVHQLTLHGRAFFDVALKDYTWYRFFGVVESQTGPWYFYFVVLCGFIPWFFYIPALIFHDLKGKLSDSREKDGVIFCWLLVILTFLFFTVSKTKLPNYILSLFPFLSLLLARYFTDPKAAFKKITTVIAWSVFAICTTAAAVVPLDPHYVESRLYIVGFFGVFLVGFSLLLFWRLVRKEWKKSIIAYSGATVVISLYLAFLFFPKVATYIDVFKMSDALKHEPKPYKLVFWGVFSPHIMVRLDSNFTGVETADAFYREIDSHQTTYAVLRNESLPLLNTKGIAYKILRSGHEMSAIEISR